MLFRKRAYDIRKLQNSPLHVHLLNIPKRQRSHIQSLYKDRLLPNPSKSTPLQSCKRCQEDGREHQFSHQPTLSRTLPLVVVITCSLLMRLNTEHSTRGRGRGISLIIQWWIRFWPNIWELICMLSMWKVLCWSWVQTVYRHTSFYCTSFYCAVLCR